MRGGRLTALISLSLDLWVDSDTEHYPAWDIDFCTTCSEAVKLNLTMFGALHIELANNG